MILQQRAKEYFVEDLLVRLKHNKELTKFQLKYCEQLEGAQKWKNLIANCESGLLSVTCNKVLIKLLTTELKHNEPFGEDPDADFLNGKPKGNVGAVR